MATITNEEDYNYDHYNSQTSCPLLIHIYHTLVSLHVIPDCEYPGGGAG